MIKKIIILICLIILFLYLYNRYNPFGHKLFSNFRNNEKKETVINDRSQIKEPATAKEYFERGSRKVKNNNFKGAVNDYSKAIKLNPEYMEAFQARALAKDKLKDFTGAKQDYDYAIILKSNLNKAKTDEDYINLMKLIKEGDKNFKLKKYHEAVYEYTNAINLYPQYQEGYIGRADANYTLKNYQDALADYDKAIRMNSNIKLFFKRANTKYMLKQYKDAAKDYNEVLALNPQHEKAYYKLTSSLIYEQKFEEALKTLYQYISLSKSQNINVNDFNNWNDILNKYQGNETIRDIKNSLKNLKISQSAIS